MSTLHRALLALGLAVALPAGVTAAPSGHAAPPAARAGSGFSQLQPPPLCSAQPGPACINQPSYSWQGVFTQPVRIDMPTMVVDRGARGGEYTGRVTFSIIDAGTAKNGDASHILGFKNPQLLLMPIEGWSDPTATDVYMQPDPGDASHCQGDKLACTYVTTSTNLRPGWYRATDANGLMAGAQACPASSPNGVAGCYETYSESAVYIPRATDVAPPSVEAAAKGKGLTVKAVAAVRDPYGKAVTLTWDFGDGSTQHGAAGKVVTHTYATPADYTVTAKVTTSDGRSSADSVSAGIFPPAPVLQGVGRIGATTTGAAAVALQGWPTGGKAILWSFTDGCPPSDMTEAQSAGGIFSSNYVPVQADGTVGLGLNYLPLDADAYVVEVRAALDFDGRQVIAHKFSGCVTSLTPLTATTGAVAAGATEIPADSASVPIGHVVALDVASSAGGNPDLSEQRLVTGHGSLTVDPLDRAHASGAWLLDAGAPLDPYVVPGPPTAPTTPHLGATAPSPPSIRTLTVARGGKVVLAVRPGANGGSPVTGYLARCTPQGKGSTRQHTGSRSPVTVTGLTRGARYRCVVRATNDLGYGGASKPSKVFTAR
ncbi:PKD domain-containing protein [Nocardioides sp.]|uniref:PKD domain-containing protein n=1 Tax=Nocardioides sp. TaxID=35761 RepID=UPI0037841F8C